MKAFDVYQWESIPKSEGRFLGMFKISNSHICI